MASNTSRGIVHHSIRCSHILLNDNGYAVKLSCLPASVMPAALSMPERDSKTVNAILMCHVLMRLLGAFVRGNVVVIVQPFMLLGSLRDVFDSHVRQDEFQSRRCMY